MNRDSSRAGLARRLSIVFVVSLIGVLATQVGLYYVHRVGSADARARREEMRLARSALVTAGDRSRLAMSHSAMGVPSKRSAREDSVLTESLRARLDSLLVATRGAPVERARVLAAIQAIAHWEDLLRVEQRAPRGDAVGMREEQRAFDSVRAQLNEVIATAEVARDHQRDQEDFYALIALLLVGAPLSGLAVHFVRVMRRADVAEAEIAEHAQALAEQESVLDASNAARHAAEVRAAEARRHADATAVETARVNAVLDAALQSMPVALAVIDRNMRYVRVNEACSVMTGVPVEGHPGRTLREVNPHLSPELERAFREVLTTGVPKMNVAMRRPTMHAPGGSLDVVLHITPFRDRSGTIQGICSAAADVTEWKALQDRFFQSQKLESVGRIAASIAHDFNNLLTVIATYCELVLMEMPPGSRYREELNAIHGAAARASSLSRRMLGASRSKSMIVKPVDLDAVVRDAKELLTHAMRDRVRLEIRTGGQGPVVVADPTQIEQVLMNLVLNAVDAIEGTGTVTVSTQLHDLTSPLFTSTGDLAPGPYVELSVRDTGAGIDDETRGRIFEPFFTTKPRDRGTGLGLSTVFAIARELGGAIEIDTTVGVGTEFHVFLPRWADSARAAADAQLAERVTAALPRGTETLLLVEDEDALRSSMRRLLTRQGYQVIEARHGGEAIRLAMESPQVSLIVSDLHMPAVDGLELARRLAEREIDLPILYISGSTGRDDMPDGSAGALGRRRYRFISKPFAIEDLLVAVREMLDEEGAVALGGPA